MTYRKIFSTSPRGFLLLDIILALALAGTLMYLTGSMTLLGQEVYDRAERKQVLLDAFTAHEQEFSGMMPYEEKTRDYDVASSSEKIIIKARARWYGNDRIETDMNVSLGGGALDFAGIRNWPTTGGYDGTPLCVIDFVSKSRVGSYSYWSDDSVQIKSSIKALTLPVNPLLPLTDLVVRNGVAYVSADSAIASDPDLVIADIHDPQNIRSLSSLNTGPGIAAIALAGDHVFAAAASTAAQLHIIKLNGLDSIYLAKKYQLPLPEASTSPPTGSSIFYRDKKIYLGTEKWDGQEFNTIDVSNPENPAKISGSEFGSKVNRIFVRDGIADVAASGQDQLIRLDASDPVRPFAKSVFSPSGWQRQEGKAVSSFEDKRYLGRTSGGFNIAADKELFGLSTSTDSVPNFSVDIPGGVYGIAADRRNIFAATRTLNEEFTVFDARTGSTTIRISLPVQPQTLTCEGNRLYILAKTAPVIYEITFE